MKQLLFIFPVLLLLNLAACKKNNDSSAACPNGVSATFKNLTGLDGCGYVLELSDGSRLEITNLSALNLTPEDGMKVKVEYSNQNDQASICMVGAIVRVDCISVE